MSRIVVVGATGRTGRHIVKHAVADGNIVVAVFRNPILIGEVEASGAQPVLLDLADASDKELAAAMVGADAVIFAAGTRENEDNVEEIDRDGAIKSADAAAIAGVKRYVQISAMGVRTGLPSGLDDKMKAYFAAKTAGDEYLADSNLNFTILEPGELTDERGRGTVSVANVIGRFASIPREDVAITALAAVREPATIGKRLELVSGQDTPSNALKKAAG